MNKDEIPGIKKKRPPPKISFIRGMIEDCKQIYEANDGKTISPVHLKALANLCELGRANEIDCQWIYDAFKKELASRYETNSVNFYMGAFSYAMIMHGASLNQTKNDINKWIGMSPRQVEICHALFKEYAHSHTFSWGLLQKDGDVSRMASAVINSIQKPYPPGRSSAAFNSLKKTIEDFDYKNEFLPFEHDYTKKRRG